MNPNPPRETQTMDDDRPPVGSRRFGRFMMQVLWPAFLMAIVAEGVLFSMVDPRDLVVIGLPLADSRGAAYTVGFFAFWALFACSSGITYLLSHGMDDRSAGRP